MGIAGLSLPLVVPSSVVLLVIGAKKASAEEAAADQGKGGDGKELGGPLVEAVGTLGRPVGVGVAGAVLVVSVTASRGVGKGGGVAGLSLPLVETLGGPVGVGVAGAVLVVSVTASRVVGKGRGVAGLSLPPDKPGVATKGARQTRQTKTSIGQGTKTNQGEGTNLPLVKAVSTLGGPVGVGVAGTVLVVAITA